MKELRFLLLGFAICLASGVKAQFYDGPDDIYYYVECNEQGEPYSEGYSIVLNFDGLTAANLCSKRYSGEEAEKVYDTRQNIQNNTSFYEDRVETTQYSIKYESSSPMVTYKVREYYHDATMYTPVRIEIRKFQFSTGRDKLYYISEWRNSERKIVDTGKRTFKRVDKSFFKVGRSRTPSGTMHE